MKENKLTIGILLFAITVFAICFLLKADKEQQRCVETYQLQAQCK